MPEHDVREVTGDKSHLLRQVARQPKKEAETPGVAPFKRNAMDQVVCRLGDASCATAHASRLSRATVSQPPQSANSLLNLQRSYGNRYVQRVVALSRQGDGETEVAPEVEEAIQAARGGGQALDSAVRARMEPAFGADFGGVRVHTGSQADALNRQLSARAFTTGQDIFFKQGEYNPGSSKGRELLAHELTHVVQQAGKEIQGKLVIGQPGDTYEQEADQVASSVMRQERQPGQQEAVQRQLGLEEGGKKEPLRTKPDHGQVQQQVEGEEEKKEEESVQMKLQDTLTIAPNVIQLSPISDELEQLWSQGTKEEFFDRLRNLGQSDQDVVSFVEANLSGDDLWLARNLCLYGPETAWPIHLRVEREMKGWADSGGEDAVFDILRNANGTEAGNAALVASIRNVFPNGTQDRWLANVLQALGPEGSWPPYLASLWLDIVAGTMPVPDMEVSGAELAFEDITLPNQTAYNCYEYAMGETSSFRQPGGGVPEANMTTSGVLALLTSDMGSPPADCDTACPSGRRKIMAVVTDDVIPGSPPLVRTEIQPTKIIYWQWDFHFYRQDIGGIWSHKPGQQRHRLTDIEPGGHQIVDPRTADRASSQDTGIIQFGRHVWEGIDYQNIVGCWCVAPGTR